MRGYLEPDIPELKIKDYETYHAYRCGIQNELLKTYGVVSRFLINKDVILIALISDSLAGRVGTVNKSRFKFVSNNRENDCWVSKTKGVRQAAQIQILILWYELLDRLNKSESFAEKVMWNIRKSLLKSAYKKAIIGDGVILDRLLKQASAQKQATAQAEIKDYSIAMKYAENIYSAILLFCASNDADKNPLCVAGRNLGRMFYLLRALERFDRDKKYKRYNVFIENGMTKEMAIASGKRQFNEAMAEFIKLYVMLDLKCYRSLLDNIVYYGMEHTVENLGKPKSKKSVR